MGVQIHTHTHTLTHPLTHTHTRGGGGMLAGCASLQVTFRDRPEAWGWSDLHGERESVCVLPLEKIKNSYRWRMVVLLWALTEDRSTIKPSRRCVTVRRVRREKKKESVKNKVTSHAAKYRFSEEMSLRFQKPSTFFPLLSRFQHTAVLFLFLVF